MASGKVFFFLVILATPYLARAEGPTNSPSDGSPPNNGPPHDDRMSFTFPSFSFGSNFGSFNSSGSGLPPFSQLFNASSNPLLSAFGQFIPGFGGSSNNSMNMRMRRDVSSENHGPSHPHNDFGERMSFFHFGSPNNSGFPIFGQLFSSGNNSFDPFGQLLSFFGQFFPFPNNNGSAPTRMRRDVSPQHHVEYTSDDFGERLSFFHFGGGNSSDPFSQFMSFFSQFIPTGFLNNTGSGRFRRSDNSENSSDEEEQSPAEESNGTSVEHEDKFCFFSLFRPRPPQTFSTVIGCNYTTQAGYSCAGCTTQLLCNVNNVGTLRTCPSNNPYCFNGVCGQIVNTTCTTTG